MGDVRARDVDRGWAWVVLVAVALNLTLHEVFVFCIGMFQVEFHEAFQGSQGFVALVCAFASSGQLIVGPLAGVMADQLTHRVTMMVGGAVMSLAFVCSGLLAHSLYALLLLFGLMAGVGAGLSYTPCLTATSLYFRRYRTLANGLTLACPGIGVLSGPYFLRWLLDTEGWRYALVIYGCLMAQMCVLGALIFPIRTQNLSTKRPSINDDHNHHDLNHEDDDERAALSREDSNTDSSQPLAKSHADHDHQSTPEKFTKRLTRLLCHPFVWIICINQLFVCGGLSINVVLFPAFASSVSGVTLPDIPKLYTSYGVTISVSRVAAGFIFSTIPKHLVHALFGLQVALAFLFALLPVYGVSLLSLFVAAVMKGLLFGPMFVLLSPVMLRYVHLQDLAVVFGLVMMCGGLAFIGTPTLAGIAYDVFKSYSAAYYIAGTAMALGAIPLLFLLVGNKVQLSSELQDKKPQSSGLPSSPTTTTTTTTPPSPQAAKTATAREEEEEEGDGEDDEKQVMMRTLPQEVPESRAQPANSDCDPAVV